MNVNFMRNVCDCDLKVADGLIKSGYIGGMECAILETSIPPEEYLNPPNRKHRYWMKKKWRDANDRYHFGILIPPDYAHDMYDINTSMWKRCGREMIGQL